MIGLGVLATGSGATALTGATLSNTVSPTADFRVNVDTQDLIVKRGPNFGSGNQDISNGLGDIPDSSVTYVDAAASSGLDGETTFTAAANDSTNGSLDFGVLIPFDQIPTSNSAAVQTSVSEAKEYTFPDLLQIDNRDTSNAKQVVLQYADSISGGAAQDPNGYVTTGADEAVDGTGDFTNPLVGTAVDDNDDLSFDEVANIFEFSVDDSDNGNTPTRVSPPGSGTPGNSNQLPNHAIVMNAAGGAANPTSVAVDLTLNLNNTIGDEIAGFVSSESLNTNGGTIRLVDTIFVSETDDSASDTVSGDLTPNTI
jgi:hypothetical protein